MFGTDISTFCTGELPKELGKLVRLERFDVSENDLTGPLSTRSERSNGSC